MSIVSYSTFRRWVREAEVAHLTQEDACQPDTRPIGRPRTASDIRDLVIKLARENIWGYTRVLGELRKLGIESISRSTVKAILKEHHIAPAPDRPHGSWFEFIRIHAATLVQCDFLSKPVWTPKGLITLYVLAFIHIGSRRLWLSPSTRQPDAAWVTQQAERFQQHAKVADIPLTILLRDNDVKYPPAFDEVFRQVGVQIPKMPPRAPNLRAHVERVIQTIKHEVLNAFIVTGEQHFNHILKSAQDWYNSERSHSSRDHLPPGWDKPPKVDNTVIPSEIICTTRLGGLLNSYSRRAA